MVTIKNTADVESAKVKICIYGQSGAGKTTSLASMPSPIVISAEAGLLSLRRFKLPYIEIKTLADLREVYVWATKSDEARHFETIAIDSLSEVAEVVLAAEKKASKDPRKAYGEMQDQMHDLVRAFRDLPKHVAVTAKLDKVTDETGRIFYGPGMPGQKLGQAIPYFFDEVFALRVERDADGNEHRALLTSSDGSWVAKDRSGILDQWEGVDLGAIVARITG
jgi:phage nucleotide-binding protein